MADLSTPCISCGVRPRSERRRLCVDCYRAENREKNRGYYARNKERFAAQYAASKGVKSKSVAWRTGPVVYVASNVTTVMLCDECPYWGSVVLGGESGEKRATGHAVSVHNFRAQSRLDVPAR